MSSKKKISRLKKQTKFSSAKFIHIIATRLFNISPSLFNFASEVYTKNREMFRSLERITNNYSKVSTSSLRTIYIIASGDPNSSVKSGIGRVENFFYSSLTDKEQSLFRVIPVTWEGGTFVVSDGSQSAKLSKKFSKRQVEIWNPSKNDILFIQFYTIFGTHDKSKIQSIVGRCKIAVSIYDIVPITHPEWFPDYLSEGFLQFFDSALVHANLLIVNSDKTKGDIETYMATIDLSVNNHKPIIKKVDLWSVATPQLQSQKLRRKELVPQRLFQNLDPVLLLLSAVEPRKGHQELISAAKEAWTVGARFNLLFVGRLGWISESFKTEFENFLETECDRAIWYKSVEDDELERLFGLSDILVSPSLDEGYGLPIAEALQRGLPVLANGIPVYQELFGSHAVLYGPGERYSSLENALESIDSVITISSNLITSEQFPNMDSTAELLESFEDI
jgi:glycosyltransferase involved in cell wall biosynthesis